MAISITTTLSAADRRARPRSVLPIALGRGAGWLFVGIAALTVFEAVRV